MKKKKLLKIIKNQNKEIALLKAQLYKSSAYKNELKKNGIKLRKNNDTGTSVDNNYYYQYNLGKKDYQKGITNDFDESKNGWTDPDYAHLGNLYLDVCRMSDFDPDEYNPYTDNDVDDSDNATDEDSDKHKSVLHEVLFENPSKY